jgi:hypothetical protein
LHILEKKAPTPKENRLRLINSSCARIKLIFNLWPIFCSKNSYKYISTYNVVCSHTLTIRDGFEYEQSFSLKGGEVMQKLFNFLMIGLAFAVLNVATVTAQDNFIDPDCPPGTPPGTVCDDPATGGADGKTFIDPDCPPGTPAGTIC